LTLAINQDLLKKARKRDINFSSFLEIRLREYIALADDIIKGVKGKRTYGDSNPSIRLRRPEGYPDYLIGPITHTGMKYLV
jgi:hypothetical protein